MENNDSPNITVKKPVKAELEAGTEYFWCRRGRSQSQPFCDGSFRGSSITPLKFRAHKNRGGGTMSIQGER